MAHRRHTGPALLAVAGLLLPGTTWARQNIAIGELSIGYDYQERNYDQEEPANPATTEPTDSPLTTESPESTPSTQSTMSTASTESTVSPQPPTPTLSDPREGDTRSLFVTPRIRVSSKGATDLVEFTYGPTFTWDEVDNSDNVGHDLSLNAEKNLTKDWLIQGTDSFYYGQDSVSDYERRSGAIGPTVEQSGAKTEPSADVPGTKPSRPGPDADAGQIENAGQALTDDYGRQEYWRNDFGLRTDYTYAQDSVFGAGYNFGMLRNVGDTDGGYDEHDRHEGIGRLSYRFSNKWQAETELGYVKGLYDKAEITVLRPEKTKPIETESPDEESGTNDTTETKETVEGTEAETETIAFEETTEEVNDDLEEYRGLFKVNYNWRPQDTFFGMYSYSAAEYESALDEDSAIHTITLGWSHDFSSRLRMTLSGGPTFVTYEESASENGYNASAGLTWSFFRSSLAASTAYSYEFENFDGRRSGLSKTWRSQVAYSYLFTEQLQATVSGGYEQSDRENPRQIETVVLLEEDEEFQEKNYSSEQFDHFGYTEKTWDAGVSVGYNFLRWYTVSVSYRYADYQSDYDQDYDEHRVLLSLTATSEIFRW